MAGVNTPPVVYPVNGAVVQKKSSAAKIVALIVALLVGISAAVVAGVLLIPRLLVSTDDLLAQGAYAQAYERAGSDEKEDVLTENQIAYLCKDVIEELKDPSSFKLRNAWYDQEGQYIVLKVSGKNSQLPITGKHSIEARSGEHSSVILVNKVDAPNPDYAMDNRKNVTNWFDGELDESCWSVKDNMAAATADPKVGPILKQISDKAAAARGDVAAAVKDNPALVAMMERAMRRMTIESMLMQAGASEEDIKQLNRVLQGISKE